ncbi:hypothetical protein, partial [Noviherbaspirillum sp.]|uniref:hypothetical protein n=1 Tax=Noviherbaspirillum sp. TaxID=1926288 RepID=UPI002FE27311
VAKGCHEQEFLEHENAGKKMGQRKLTRGNNNTLLATGNKVSGRHKMKKFFRCCADALAAAAKA